MVSLMFSVNLNHKVITCSGFCMYCSKKVQHEENSEEK
jgi:hypothetical protein